MTDDYYKKLLDSVDFAVAEHEIIYDETGNPVDYRFLYVNGAFCMSLNMKEEDIIGKTVYEILPGTEISWVERYNNVVVTGVSTNFINFAAALDQYFSVFAYKSKDKCFVTSFKNITSFVKAGTPQVKNEIISNLFSSGKTAYFEFDIKKKKFDYSDTLKEIIGMDIVSYKDYIDVFVKYAHPADKKRVDKIIDTLFSGEKDEIAMQIRFYNQVKKEYVWISYFAYIEKRYRNVPVLIKGLVKDIDKEKHQILENERMNKLFLETRKIANITTFYYSFINKKFNSSKEFSEFLGVEEIEILDDVRRTVHPEDLELYDASTSEIQFKKTGIVSNYRIIKNDKVRYIQSSVFGEYDESGKISGVFGILKDISEVEESKRDIEYFANHDVLTGLFNRNNFEIYNKTFDNQIGVGVLICDVDGLKLINDAFGHIEGDELLVSLAKTLKDVAGTENVFRIGGDEFVIILNDANEDIMLKMEQDIKKEILSFRLHSVGFDASIGYSFIEEDKTFEEAFRIAENLMYRRKLTERKSRKSTALSTIMQTMHEKTEETEEHCQRVGELSAQLLRLSGKKREHEVEEIKLVANVHDIGKISISDKILNKPSKLNASEYEAIKYHSESGYKIISNIIDNEDIAIAVLYHHEKYDGTGYPHGLKGENIPLYSRILSICDAFDAMISNRVYRDALSKKQALKEIKRNAGTQFDPVLVERFLKIV
ncbi:Cyclic di-GMP phosphodiesterase response regulator RpfG [Candidatus Izimaplasma bacterium HR1]|uniref:HD domain-containing phosphohydrolase n=1 Tax=Candidatus Izimoplasma sp. HR1 TaxID=1541959 RepID=UPI0004F7087D|nr:Cyclic di-GMP phosphodiesterase response regulator RpfG [Candidatus Izimaplasma bacterium HR1]